MKLGFVSAILGDLSLEEVFSHAADIGYDCVEVMCWPVGDAERRYAGVTHIDVLQLASQIDDIQNLIQKYQVEISGLGYYPNPLSPDAEEARVAIEHIRRVIDACDSLGIQKMNTFIGRDWQLNMEDNWTKFRDVWPDIIHFAEDKNVQVGIENCPMYFTDDEWPGGKNLATCPHVWRRMFEEIPSQNFGLNYDPSHLVWQHVDYIRPTREFADKVFHVHAKDARIDWNAVNELGMQALPNQMHSPKLPGLGEVNWGDFVSALNDIGYDGPVCVEVEDRAYEGSLERRVSALRQSHAFLRNYIPVDH